jgi:hypothetical protein
MAFFAPMKRLWRRILTTWKATPQGQRCATLPKSEFPHLLNQMWIALSVNAGQNLCSGFQTCGITPVSAEPILKRLPKANAVDVDAVGQGFRKFVEDTRKGIEEMPGRKRKKTNVVAGLYFPNLLTNTFCFVSRICSI